MSAKQVLSRLSANKVKDDLDAYVLENEEHLLHLKDRVYRLEQLLEEHQNKRMLPTYADFKFFLTTNLSRLLMVALILYGGYNILNSDVTKRIWKDSQNNTVIVDGVNLSGNIEDVSKRYAVHLTGSTERLKADLTKLEGVISGAVNPMSELRAVIQYEEPQWRDAVGEKFNREYRAGAAANFLVEGIRKGLP